MYRCTEDVVWSLHIGQVSKGLAGLVLLLCTPLAKSIMDKATLFSAYFLTTKTHPLSCGMEKNEEKNECIYETNEAVQDVVVCSKA